MPTHFDLILTGRTLAGHSREAAAAALAKLMRLPEERALGLLSGRETVVKRGLDEVTLAPYAETLRKAGAEVRVNGVATPDAAVAAAAAQAAAGIAPARAVTETIKCPACGAEQPRRTLCVKCGANMPRLLAAQAEAKDLPRPKADPLPTAPMRMSQEQVAPFRVRFMTWYKKSLPVEILVFLFLTLWWAICAAQDRERGMPIRALGGLIIVLSAVLTFSDFFSQVWRDPQEVAVKEAIAYAFGVADRVGDYAIANQRMPQRTDSIDLPANTTRAVRSVVVGPEGQVRVTLSDDLRKVAGGTIVLTPVVESGVIRWRCGSENLPSKYLVDDCN